MHFTYLSAAFNYILRVIHFKWSSALFKWYADCTWRLQCIKNNHTLLGYVFKCYSHSSKSIHFTLEFPQTCCVVIHQPACKAVNLSNKSRNTSIWTIRLLPSFYLIGVSERSFFHTMADLSLSLSRICRKVIHLWLLTDSLSRSVYHHSRRNENSLCGLSLSLCHYSFSQRATSADLNRWHYAICARSNRAKHALQVGLWLLCHTLFFHLLNRKVYSVMKTKRVWSFSLLRHKEVTQRS